MGQGGWEGDARERGYGGICIRIADSLCYTAETNSTVKQLYPNKDVKNIYIYVSNEDNFAFQFQYDVEAECRGFLEQPKYSV